jgi:1-deoxy-D-xylulose-5-phosphate reductoisomerase
MTVSILGATGSIGTSTLDLIARHPGRFLVEAVTANSNAEALADVAKRSGARAAVVADPTQYQALKSALSGTRIEAAAGLAALDEAAARPADCVMAAIVGAAGLRSTLVAVQQGRRLALANKECLVSAGHLFMAAVKRSGAELLPVDSEHAGVFQALIGHDRAGIERITITASGGPFRTWNAAEIAAATPEQALKHPNWSMGRKITIDSATLMNKGLELIEAHHLFDVEPDQLDVLVHPQSIVHALVSYVDGAVLAQLACPDMRTPIAMALAWPQRMPAPTQKLDLASLATLNFEAPDLNRFPALGVAIAAMRRGGAATAVLNAANEVAVEAFLAGRLSFPGIAAVVEQTLEAMERGGLLVVPSSLDAVLEIDIAARKVASERLNFRP